jgi:hypothetical protein
VAANPDSHTGRFLATHLDVKNPNAVSNGRPAAVKTTKRAATKKAPARKALPKPTVSLKDAAEPANSRP